MIESLLSSVFTKQANQKKGASKPFFESLGVSQQDDMKAFGKNGLKKFISHLEKALEKQAYTQVQNNESRLNTSNKIEHTSAPKSDAKKQETLSHKETVHHKDEAVKTPEHKIEKKEETQSSDAKDETENVTANSAAKQENIDKSEEIESPEDITLQTLDPSNQPTVENTNPADIILELVSSFKDMLQQALPEAKPELKEQFQEALTKVEDIQSNLEALNTLKDNALPDLETNLKILKTFQNFVTDKTIKKAEIALLKNSELLNKIPRGIDQRLQSFIGKLSDDEKQVLSSFLSSFSKNTGLSETSSLKGKSFSQFHFEFQTQGNPKDDSPLEILPQENTFKLQAVVGDSPQPAPVLDLTTSSVESAQRIAVSDSKSNNIVEFNGSGIQKTSAPPTHQQVADAVSVTLNNGKKEISIQLKPVELGEVRLTLNSNTENHVSAKLITETREAKEILEKNISDLTRTLEMNGVRIGKITIVQAGAETFESKNQQFEQPGQQNAQQNQHQSLSQQQSQQQQPSSEAFNQNPSNSFTDGGSSSAEDEASSISAFDKDVEGEEVSSATNEKSLIDIKA